jgi:hypothetical protein
MSRKFPWTVPLCHSLPYMTNCDYVNSKLRLFCKLGIKTCKSRHRLLRLRCLRIHSLSLASVPCAPLTEVPQTPVTPFANAVHAGPSVVSASLSEKKKIQLISAATQAYKCIVEHLESDHIVPKSAKVLSLMLRERVGEEVRRKMER